ncbi:MAG TPA: PH domain-containing protein [Nitrolancea sp.]|nr:PH domain-containing protein [Nitrolancea sp.]
MSDLHGMLGSGEVILITARRHPLFLAGRLALSIIGALILIGVGIWLAVSVNTYAGIVLLIASLVPIVIGLIKFLNWRNEVYAVTNDRIIQVEGLLSRRVFDSSLEKVNDILLTQSLIGRMLDYGTIEIITGSDAGLNRLDALKDPLDFKRAILDARNELEGHRRGMGQQFVADDRSQLLESLDNLRSSGVLSEAEYEIKRSRLFGRNPEV